MGDMLTALEKPEPAARYAVRAPETASFVGPIHEATANAVNTRTMIQPLTPISPSYWPS